MINIIYILYYSLRLISGYSVNDSVRDKSFESFASYIECIDKRNKEILNEDYRKAVIVEYYNSITLKCNTCKRVDLINTEDYIIWKFQYKSQASPVVLDINEIEFNAEKFEVNVDRDELTIHNAADTDEGHYWCEIYNTITVINDYFVNVVPSEIKIPLYENAKENSKFNYDNSIYKPALNETYIIFINWERWSECSTCNRIGVKIRVGYCYIKLKNEFEKIDKSYLKIFKYYKKGLPCHSSLVPLKVKNKFHDNKSFRSFIMYGSCNISCLHIITVSTVKNETVVEITDVKQLKHHDFHPKKNAFISNNQILYAVRNKPLRLRCVTSSHAIEDHTTKYEKVNWRKDGDVLISSKADGISFDDQNNTIQIRSVNRNHTGVYSCYKNDNLVSMIKVRINSNELQAFKRIFKDEMRLYEQNLSVSFGSVIMVATFLVILFYSFLSRATRRKI
jgi:hypothetical protein